MTNGALVERALAVLAANQLGDATVPSPVLYPHQWSWDTAFMAMAYARHDPARARVELTALFRGQWTDGMLPHIVFSERHDYFPGAGFWQSGRSPAAPVPPEGPATSAIVQPPVHALAVRAVQRHDGDDPATRAFVADMIPRLTAWHDHLHRYRGDADGLVEIWHPWESGMDNSPLWDDALARIALDDGVPDYSRIDVKVADPDERPTTAEYDRYVHLVDVSRRLDHDPVAVRTAIPFRIHDVVFNTLLVEAERALAELIEVAGGDGSAAHARAAATAAAIDDRLWDDELGLYVDRDLLADEAIRVRCVAGCAPLLAAIPTGSRAERVLAHVAAMATRPGPVGEVLPSLPVDDPRFLPRRYWRGPVWPVLQWIVVGGLRRHGRPAEADRVRDGLLDLVERNGFSEHYDPVDGGGHGGRQFAWTAAIVLDLLG